MKLFDCVVHGKFLGLNTVEECIANVEIHSLSLMPYERIHKELEELHQEYQLYLSGELKLDWNAVDRELTAWHQEYQGYLDNVG